MSTPGTDHLAQLFVENGMAPEEANETAARIVDGPRAERERIWEEGRQHAINNNGGSAEDNPYRRQT